MLKKIILLLFISIGYSNASQDLPDFIRAESKQYVTDASNYSIHHHKRNKIQEYGDVERRNYDVLRYDVSLDLDKPLSATLDDTEEERKTFEGSVKIRVQLLDDSETIEFDAENMEILKVGYLNSGGFPIVDEVEFTYVDGIITIQVPDHFKKNDIETFMIYYKSVADDFENFRKNRGMHIYHKGLDIGDKDNEDNSVKVEHNIAYSMSEPELARYWMPCNDRPYDKALSSVSILVPKGYTAVSNGYLFTIDTTGFDFNKVIFHWANKEPIATYLMNFAVSIYEEYVQEVIVDNDTIPMLHYAWPEDMNGDYFKLIPSMDTHPLMMEVLTDNFGPYPFSRYGTVTVYPFPYGGMEHQTNVTQNRFWIRNNGDGGFVHEMGHHWFGDMMTCATWADIWINEGGATFTEALYFGENGGTTSYRDVIEGKIARYLYESERRNIRPMYAVPLNTFFGGDGYLIYEKGAIFLNQMKENLGDEQFFSVLKEILQEYKYKSITTDEFRQAWKEKVVNPMVNIDSFFDQWVYSAGHPEFTIETDIDLAENDKYKLELTVSQVQNQEGNPLIPDLFVTPIRFEYTNGEKTEYSELFLNDEMTQVFTFETEFEPTEVSIDQLSVAHLLNSSIITSVELDDYVGGIEIFPNPSVKGFAQLNMNIEQSVQNGSIELVDILGNKIKKIFSGSIGEGGISFRINTSELASGIYIVTINLDGVSTSRKIVVQ